MKIVIVGAGNVGMVLIEQLANEGHDLIVVDIDAGQIEHTVNNFDIMGVVGNGVSAEILQNAGIEDADLLVACTQYDEMNILCCMVAKKLGAKDTIARVRNPEYFTIFNDVELGLSMLVNPEYETAMEISRMLKYPSAIKIEPFANGKVDVVELKVSKGSPLAGLKLKQIAPTFSVKLLVCAVDRHDEVFIPTGDFVLEAEDKIYVTASTKDINDFFKALNMANGTKKVLIAGGSRTAYYLAKELRKSNIKVKIIEIDENKCDKLEEILEKTDVICGDATDQDLLLDEGLLNYDAFISLCGIDERNIIMSMFATTKRVKKVITKVDKRSYFSMLENSGIESVISIATSTVNEIARYVRSKENSVAGKVSKLYRIINNKAEVLEFSVSKGFKGASVPIKDLRVKSNLLIAGIVRNEVLITPGGNDKIEVDDTVLLVTTQEFLGDLNDILV